MILNCSKRNKEEELSHTIYEIKDMDFRFTKNFFFECWFRNEMFLIFPCVWKTTGTKFFFKIWWSYFFFGKSSSPGADKNNSFSLRCHFRQKMISKTVLATTFTTNLEEPIAKMSPGLIILVSYWRGRNFGRNTHLIPDSSYFQILSIYFAIRVQI